MHVACSDTAATPDALVHDAALGGLTIELVAKGGVPQMPTADVEITKVVLGATQIRAIGDAAPGDMRTTRPSYEFEWRDNLMPIPFTFRNAPPGLYSTVELRVSDSEDSSSAISVLGRARRAGDLVPFEITSLAASVPITVAVDTVLPPREIAVATIEVDVAMLIAAIDWDGVPLTGDGRLYVTDGDAPMASVVAALGSAFTER